MRTVYGIRDTASALIAEHVRVELPGGKRMYWQTPGCDARDGLYGLSTPDLPLYGSEFLRRLVVGQTVVVVEGERATEALWSLDIPALGTVTGAGSTPGEDALAVLLPYDVVLWPDYDELGEQHMARVAATLLRLGGRARRLTWAGARQKGDDAADFVARGGRQVTVELMAQAATPWTVVSQELARPTRSSYAESDDRLSSARSHMAEVALEKLGQPVRQDRRSMWWRCPFHQDRSPSFKVDLTEPYYVCFGCGAKGDVLTFLQALDGVTFSDALRALAPPQSLGGVPRMWG